MDTAALLYTFPETAQVLRVSTVTVRRLAARGELPAVRIGKGWRVEVQALAAYIKAHDTRGANAR